MEATTMFRSKWFLPGFSVALGLAFLAALWAGGKPADGVFSLAVLTGFGLLILLGGRSETIRGLRGDGRDERFARLDLVATAIAGNVLIAIVIGACIWEWAHGRDGSPFVQLGAITGVTYVLAVGFLRWRG
jgi:hypothetical protein